jgi:hypothetical protein
LTIGSGIGLLVICAAAAPAQKATSEITTGGMGVRMNGIISEAQPRGGCCALPVVTGCFCRRSTVRLLQSDAPEIADCLASGNSLIAGGSHAHLLGCLGSLAILGLTLFVAFVNIPYAFVGGIALLVAWSLVSRWRIVFVNQSWVFLGCKECLYIRAFRRRAGQPAEPDVIALDLSEVGSVSVQTREVFVRGPKPVVYEWLVIEPKPEARSFLAR